MTLLLSSALADQKVLSNLKSKKTKESSLSEEKTQCGTQFLATPYTQMFTFNSQDLQNTGPIPGIPLCCVSFIIGSVVVKSANDDAVNFLLGDIQTQTSWETNAFTYVTWWDSGGITPSLTFGSKLVAITNPGEKDNWTSFYGIWRFVMIPLKSDGSFDVIPNGYSQGLNPDYIGFNLIAYF